MNIKKQEKTIKTLYLGLLDQIKMYQEYLENLTRIVNDLTNDLPAKTFIETEGFAPGQLSLYIYERQRIGSLLAQSLHFKKQLDEILSENKSE